jgi:hypothetical protein
MKDLELMPRGESAVARPINPAEMMQAMVQKGITAENVAAFTELVKLSEHMEDRNSEREFAKAFNALQSEMPKVQARKVVPNRDGTPRYKFASFEEIMEQVSPIAQKNGFSISFSMKFGDGRIIQTCILQHIGGHRQSNDFAVRIGGGPPGSNEAQADGAASTYAKRFALCNALNIVIETDDDARTEGAPITPDQAFELERRVGETNSDSAAFLKLAGAAKFSEIVSTKYDMLDQLLKKKEQRGR